MITKIAKFISIVFHPVLIPTLGIFLFFNSGFYYSAISWEAKRFILLVVLFTTGVLPMLTVAILALNPKFDITMENSRDRIIPLLFSSVFYYLGYLLLNKVGAYSIFKLFMVASVIVIVILLLVSFKWKISNHMSAIGGLTGALFALSFRTGMNPLYTILLVVFVSGLVGTSRLILQKHNILQIFSGYFLGFVVLYLVVYFI